MSFPWSNNMSADVTSPPVLESWTILGKNQNQGNTLSRSFLCYWKCPSSSQSRAVGLDHTRVCPCFLMIREAGTVWVNDQCTPGLLRRLLPAEHTAGERTDWAQYSGKPLWESRRERGAERHWGTTAQPRKPQKHSSHKSPTLPREEGKKQQRQTKAFLAFNLKEEEEEKK